MGGDGYLSLLTDEGHTKQDVQVQDEDMKKNLREKLDKREDSDVMVGASLTTLTPLYFTVYSTYSILGG